MTRVRIIPPGGSIPSQQPRRPSRQPRRRDAKVWTFTEKPRFARVDRRLQVARDGDLSIDVFDEREELVVVVQLPGVEGDAFQLDLQGDTLVITATAGSGSDRIEYRGEQAFPFPVEEDPVSISLTNYILEVRFRRSSRGKTDHGSDGREGDE